MCVPYTVEARRRLAQGSSLTGSSGHPLFAGFESIVELNKEHVARVGGRYIDGTALLWTLFENDLGVHWGEASADKGRQATCALDLSVLSRNACAFFRSSFVASNCVS